MGNENLPDQLAAAFSEHTYGDAGEKIHREWSAVVDPQFQELLGGINLADDNGPAEASYSEGYVMNTIITMGNHLIVALHKLGELEVSGKNTGRYNRWDWSCRNAPAIVVFHHCKDDKEQIRKEQADISPYGLGYCPVFYCNDFLYDSQALNFLDTATGVMALATFREGSTSTAIYPSFNYMGDYRDLRWFPDTQQALGGLERLFQAFASAQAKDYAMLQSYFLTQPV